MDKTIKVEHKSVEDEKKRLEDIADILSEGVYSYLKREGLLSDSKKRIGRIKTLMEHTKKICARTEGDENFENNEKTLDF